MRHYRIVFVVLSVLHFIGATSGFALAADPPAAKPADKPTEKPAENAAAKPRVLRVVLKSAPDGSVSELIIDGKVVEPSKDGKQSRFEILRAKAIEAVFDAKGNRRPDEVEVEIDADDKLRYEHIINVVEAVSARKGPKGEFEQVARRVRFAPQGDENDDPAFDLPKPKK